MMMYQGLQMDIFIRELKTLLRSIVVKRGNEAAKYETVDTMRDAEMYLMVKDGIDDFSSYNTFDYEVYRAAGVSPANIVEYNLDKQKIPYGIRAALLKLQREYILDNYVERNHYYRMLMGLPDVDDTDYIYAPENTVDVRTDIPVHTLDIGSVGRLASTGIMAKLIEDHPDKLYLNYIGDRAIDCYKARKALNYELLFSRPTNPDNIQLDFKKFYNNARDYYMIAIYNPNIAKSYKYYDNFIGFCILIMAIQRLFSSVFREGITRDFYDPQLLRYLFNSYSVPYIEDMTIDQMKLLAKNLNIFLAFKSSDRVLFDLCAVFGFTNVSIYKYLLVRNHVHSSETGKPIFPTKTVVNGDGTITSSPDYEKMFEIYFQKVNMKTKDINTALVDRTNRMEYVDMTSGDIYWVDDDELREKIYTAGLNYIESKYISIDIMFKITAMMYEINHFFRMVIDNNDEFRKVYLIAPKVSPRPHDLYSYIIFLCAFFCKRYGFTGEIPLKPAAVASVYGFNFHADMAQIIADVVDSKYLDEDVIQYMLNFTVTSNKDVDRIYRNIKALKDFIVEQMASTKDIEVYRAYKKLYNSILVIEDKEVVYQKNDGSYATDYFDLLKDLDPELYFFVDDFDTTSVKDTDEMMLHVLYRLETLCNELKYLHTAVDASALVAVLLRLINFFKSYTVDLSHAGLLYLFDDRYFNMLKILDMIWQTDITWWMYDGFIKHYYDAIAGVDIEFTDKEKIQFLEDLYSYVVSSISSKLNLDYSLAAYIDMGTGSHILNQYADTLALDIDPNNKDYIKLITQIADFVVKFLIKSDISIKDDLAACIRTDTGSRILGEYSDNFSILMKLPDSDRIRLCDIIADFMTKMYCSERFVFSESLDASMFTEKIERIMNQYSDAFVALVKNTLNWKLVATDQIVDMIIRYIIDERINIREELAEELLTEISSKVIDEYSDEILASINVSHEDQMLVKECVLHMVTFIAREKLIKDENITTDIESVIKERIMNQYSDDVIAEVKKLIGDRNPLIYDMVVTVINRLFKDSLNVRDEAIQSIHDELKTRLVPEMTDSWESYVHFIDDEVLKFIDKMIYVNGSISVNDHLKLMSELVPEISNYFKSTVHSIDLISPSIHVKSTALSKFIGKLGDLFVRFITDSRVKLINKMDSKSVDANIKTEFYRAYHDKISEAISESAIEKIGLAENFLILFQIMNRTYFHITDNESIMEVSVDKQDELLKALDYCKNVSAALFESDVQRFDAINKKRYLNALLKSTRTITDDIDANVTGFISHILEFTDTDEWKLSITQSVKAELMEKIEKIITGVYSDSKLKIEDFIYRMIAKTVISTVSEKFRDAMKSVNVEYNINLGLSTDISRFLVNQTNSNFPRISLTRKSIRDVSDRFTFRETLTKLGAS